MPGTLVVRNREAPSGSDDACRDGRSDRSRHNESTQDSDHARKIQQADGPPNPGAMMTNRPADRPAACSQRMRTGHDDRGSQENGSPGFPLGGYELKEGLRSALRGQATAGRAGREESGAIVLAALAGNAGLRWWLGLHARPQSTCVRVRRTLSSRRSPAYAQTTTSRGPHIDHPLARAFAMTPSAGACIDEPVVEPSRLRLHQPLAARTVGGSNGLHRWVTPPQPASRAGLRPARGARLRPSGRLLRW